VKRRQRLLLSAARLQMFLSPGPDHKGEVFFSINYMPATAIHDALTLATQWIDENDKPVKRLIQNYRRKKKRNA
jgi:hypothetical protein